MQDLEDAIESGEQDKIEKAQKPYLEAYNKYIKLEYQYDHQRAQKTSKQKRIETLKKNLPENKQVEAWCADCSTDLSGEVGTIESVTGDVIIQPGYEGNAEYDSKRDGQLTQIMSQTPAGAFYNAAMRPGWQKWKPLYRTARITSIDKGNDTCSLILEPQGTENVAQSGNVYISELQDLIIDHRIFWDLVPIDYMYCNASSFEVDDLVVVLFENQKYSNPKVIGFVSEPFCRGGQWVDVTDQWNPPPWPIDISKYSRPELYNTVVEGNYKITAQVFYIMGTSIVESKQKSDFDYNITLDEICEIIYKDVKEKVKEQGYNSNKSWVNSVVELCCVGYPEEWLIEDGCNKHLGYGVYWKGCNRVDGVLVYDSVCKPMWNYSGNYLHIEEWQIDDC